ncbi:MAG TPA: TatD family hydrolase [Firmicutes bacterium]|nr:TatD family hydrolase [Bacillota bacterium]
MKVEPVYLVDTHAHLDDERFGADRDEVVERAARSGVKMIVNVGCDIPSSEAAIAFSRCYKGVYAVTGIHPHDAANAPHDAMDRLRDLAEDEAVVAIGEIGLDYHYELSPRDVQRELFIRQLDLARELGLPVVIHDREAHGDVMDILRAHASGPRGAGGVLHCFSGSLEMARECIKMGFYISFGGPLTFSNARRLRELATALPPDKILVETDCPYLAPVPHRGERNEPAFVRFTAEKLAEIRGVPLEEIAELTTTNARLVFPRLSLRRPGPSSGSNG